MKKRNTRKNTNNIWIDVPCQVISVDGLQFTVQVSAIKKHGMEKIKEFCRTMGEFDAKLTQELK